ncbi:MAG: putative thymidylate kinase [Parcubacteria group bacterium GW2011_GWA2_43_13]|nr:MAG: putative thymidylate kinase [Parcubacteria group bacterium GW2011_GWA2_43_13]
MKLNLYRGKFIAIEGIDGSGKTTQVKFIRDYLKESGLDVFVTKEPTEDGVGKEIRYILDNRGINKDGTKITDKELQRMYIQDRGQHILKLVVPNLGQGVIVITDRQFLSTLAYGQAFGLNIADLLKEHEKILGDAFIVPDLTIVLTVDPKEAINRLKKIKKGKDYFEDVVKLGRIKNAYLYLARKLPKNFPKIKIAVIDGSQSPEDVFEEVKKEVLKVIGREK